jgi:hypothetical protein
MPMIARSYGIIIRMFMVREWVKLYRTEFLQIWDTPVCRREKVN